MDSELITKIDNYFKKLKDELKELENERKALIKKVNDGETLSRKENKRNKELATLISEIKEKLKKDKALENIEAISQNSEYLYIYCTNKENIDAAKKVASSLLSNVKKINKYLMAELATITGIDIKKFEDIKKLQSDLEKEIVSQQENIDTMTEKGKNINDLEVELESNQDLLKTVKQYSNFYIDEVQLDADLNKIFTESLNPDDFIVLLTPYAHQLSDLGDRIYEEVKKEMEEEEILTEDEETLETKGKKKSSKAKTKEKTKKEKKDTDEALKKAIKATLGIVGTAAVIAAIVVLVKNAKLDKNKNEDTDRNLQPEPTKSATEIVEVKNPTIDRLVNKGYDEYTATLMVNNFRAETLGKLLNMPYVKVISDYASINKFNVDYLNDYESYRSMFNITATKVVDYVNRSYEIQKTNFYDDAEIDDIIKVVMAIDNKDLFTTDNAKEAQSFNTSFNRIVENYLFGTVTEEDINKLDAMKYFAKENSDLGNFLTGFGELAQNILKDPNNKEAKDKMTDYVTIFATSLNGFTNVPSALTTDDAFNKNAQVNDYFDWYMAYNSFVGPLNDVLTYPTELQNVDLFYAEEIYKDTILLEDFDRVTIAKQKEERERLLKEFGYEEYLDSIYRLYKIYDLRELMLTALNDPEINNICGQSRTLGGE